MKRDSEMARWRDGEMDFFYKERKRLGLQRGKEEKREREKEKKRIIEN